MTRLAHFEWGRDGGGRLVEGAAFDDGVVTLWATPWRPTPGFAGAPSPAGEECRLVVKSDRWGWFRRAEARRGDALAFTAWHRTAPRVPEGFDLITEDAA